MGTSEGSVTLSRVDADRSTAEGLGSLVLTLGRAYLNAVGPILEGVPQGARGYHALGAVIRGDHPTQLALASGIGIDRTAMTYLIDDLVAAGLVERQLNRSDRRQRKIVATSRGLRTMSQLKKRVSEAERTLLETLNTGELASLRDLLNRAVAGLPGGDNSCEPTGNAGRPTR